MRSPLHRLLHARLAEAAIYMIGLCVVAAAVVSVSMAGDPDVSTDFSAATVVPPATIASSGESQAWSADSFRTTLWFEPEPPAEPAPPPQQKRPAPRPQLVLIGIADADAAGGLAAIAFDASTGEVHRLTNGDAFGRWHVAEVDRQSVRLTLNDDEFSLALGEGVP